MKKYIRKYSNTKITKIIRYIIIIMVTAATLTNGSKENTGVSLITNKRDMISNSKPILPLIVFLSNYNSRIR